MSAGVQPITIIDRSDVLIISGVSCRDFISNMYEYVQKKFINFCPIISIGYSPAFLGKQTFARHQAQIRKEALNCHIKSFCCRHHRQTESFGEDTQVTTSSCLRRLEHSARIIWGCNSCLSFIASIDALDLLFTSFSNRVRLV